MLGEGKGFLIIGAVSRRRGSIEEDRRQIKCVEWGLSALMGPDGSLMGQRWVNDGTTMGDTSKPVMNARQQVSGEITRVNRHLGCILWTVSGGTPARKIFLTNLDEFF